MRRFWTLLVAALALGAAIIAGFIAQTQYETLIATTELVVPAVDIPPYTILRADLLTTRVFPAPMGQEPVYRTLDEAVGKISRISLAAGRLIYGDQAVAPSAFRYSDDERLEVVSFPVSPEQAVGGQIKPGHRINLYRVALGSAPSGAPAPALLATSPVAVDLLARAVPVVDVRAAGGTSTTAPPAPRTPTARDASALGIPSSAQPTAEKSLTIITVAVPPAVAKDIVRLMGETRERYMFWISLTPPIEVTSGK